jgi:CheY-like chemotaxis protein
MQKFSCSALRLFLREVNASRVTNLIDHQTSRVSTETGHETASKKCAAIRNCCEARTYGAPETIFMKTPVMLLLTADSGLEDLVAHALSEIGGISHLTRDAGDALEIICGVNDLDLAIIDFEHGPHGMTLLGAISALREDLPVIVITYDDEQHVEALAYANGATACLSKQAVATQLANAIRDFCKATLEQAFA